MSGFFRCILYALALALLAHPLGQALPSDCFHPEKFPLRGGGTYAKMGENSPEKRLDL